ncbi:uncharacterized protein si:ch211-13f8.1 [Alosa sapidissima]|uniref:uncharacterized protein si:ch211-13f8.1 n=1 Tax=Alosa sapidissima TaxID=34773 RepID=UPI001C095C8C|nr:uncharacterized protein si:ch211-13f8.1 [Alosa sapidissima]
MEGRKFTMGAKRPPRPVLQIKGPETVTQLAYNMQDVLTMSEPITPSSSSFSPGSSPPLPGSAVYALQSKVKAKSQKKDKILEKECDDEDTKLLFVQRRRDEALSLSSMHRPELDMPGSSDEEGTDQVQRGVFASEPSALVEQRALAAAESEGGRESPFLSVAGQTRGLGEGASLESLLTDGSGDLQGDDLTSRTSSTMSSSPSPSSRPWAPPKGFWRVARPETLVLDEENASKEMPPPGADGSQGKPKMKVGGVDLDSYGQLHHSDSLESHLRRCWKQEASAAESFEGLWRADSLENVGPPERTPSLRKRMERSKRALRQVQMLRRHNAKGTEGTAVDVDVHHSQEDDVRGTESTGMLNEGESDLVYTVSPYEFEQIYRCIVTSDDLPLSPRHEQAKRLLERARLKARSQLPKGEQPVRTGPAKVPELPVFHKAVQVAQEKANSRDLQSGSPLQHKAVAVQGDSQEEPCRDVPIGSPPLHKAVMAASQDNICREVPLGSPPLLKAVLVAAPEEICRDQPTVSPPLHKSVMVAVQDEICRDLPTGSPPLHKAVLVAAQEEIAIAPIKLVDVRGRECERGTRSRRVGQSPTRVRFEDESEREAERRYLERVRQRGPVVTDKSQNAATKPEQSRGMSTATIRKEDEGAANQVIIPQEEVVGKCDACGSLLGIIIAKDAHGQPVLSTADGRGKLVPKWVSPGPADQPQSYNAGDTDLAAMAALADSMGGAGEGGAGEQVSGFGKLRRRSLKGERRDEAGHVLGPYARSQDLWAQRRNSYSKMRAGMEEGSLLYTQSMPMAPQGVTFSLDAQSMLGHVPAAASGSGILKDTSSPQLPLKSALKSSSKNLASGQRVLTLLPSVQYRLVHLDQEKEGKPHHIELSADEQLTVMAGTSSTGLTPCIKQSSLRYTTAKMTSDLPSQGLWETSSEAVPAHLGGEDLTGACAPGGPLECRPALRCGVGTKADDLRSELLRAEHRKAELMWEDMPESARRAMMEQEGKSKLSLRRFFSAMGLNSVGKLVKGNRSSSMDHLCSPSARHIAPAPISASASPSPSHHPRTRLQRTPSLQSLHTESPLAQLRKVSSVQSLQSPKRLKERSTILGAVPYNLAPREFDQDPCLGDLEAPRGPQGRLVQAYTDGTLHIELSRPANGPFGFVISRGKGRPGSGVFVDQVGDTSADSIYTGLLGVGDEILEVNGEMVAGLSLEQVTRLMTRDSTASIRIIPHRWIQS